MDSLTKTLFCLVVAVTTVSHCTAAVDRTFPTIRLFSVDQSNQIGNVLSAEPNSEVIVETEDVRFPGIRMECSAPYPVQWVYSGNGIPTSEQSILSASPTEYRSILVIKTLLETHTGKYKCSSVEIPSMLTYIYVYVPGQTLFVPKSGKSVEISSKYVLLPCTASSPRVKVYLQKLTGPQLVRPATYDPRRGYTFEVEEAPKAEGTYICKGAYRGITNVLEYQVTVIQPDEDHSIQSDRRFPEYITESDVPCNPPCTDNAKCLLRGTYSECQCLQPFQGDGYRQCIDPNPASKSQQRPSQNQESGGSGCKTHTDCPDDTSCFVDGKCRDPCIHSQHGLKCATNGICKTVDHQPTCACPPGSSGDGTRSCTAPYQGDAPGTSSRSTPRPRTTLRPRGSSTSRPSSNPEYEYICRVDSDCGKGKFCNGTFCTDPCEDLCGDNANCKVVNGSPLCSCKPGHRGDPWKRCDSTDAVIKLLTPDPIKVAPQAAYSNSKLGAQICDTNEDCPAKYKCEGFKCVDPCSKCADDAECDLYDGETVPKCRCPESYTGDGEVGCLPDLQVDVYDFFPSQQSSSGQPSTPPGGSTTESGSNSSLCQSISCGPHSECRLIEGLPKCNCLSGYIGKPPNCRAECTEDSQCGQNKLCVQKRCRNACYGKCGAYARCRNNPETKTQTCTCRKGYGGDPYKECKAL